MLKSSFIDKIIRERERQKDESAREIRLPLYIPPATRRDEDQDDHNEERTESRVVIIDLA